MYSNEFKIVIFLLLIHIIYSYFKNKSLEKMSNNMNPVSQENLLAIKNLGSLASSILQSNGNIVLPGNVKVNGEITCKKRVRILPNHTDNVNNAEPTGTLHIYNNVNTTNFWRKNQGGDLFEIKSNGPIKCNSLVVNKSATGGEPFRIEMPDNKYLYFNTNRHELGVYGNNSPHYIQIGSFYNNALRVNANGNISNGHNLVKYDDNLKIYGTNTSNYLSDCNHSNCGGTYAHWGNGEFTIQLKKK